LYFEGEPFTAASNPRKEASDPVIWVYKRSATKVTSPTAKLQLSKSNQNVTRQACTILLVHSKTQALKIPKGVLSRQITAYYGLVLEGFGHVTLTCRAKALIPHKIRSVESHPFGP